MPLLNGLTSACTTAHMMVIRSRRSLASRRDGSRDPASRKRKPLKGRTRTSKPRHWRSMLLPRSWPRSRLCGFLSLRSHSRHDGARPGRNRGTGIDDGHRPAGIARPSIGYGNLVIDLPSRANTMRSARTRAAPIQLEVAWNRLISIASEQAAAMVNSSFSAVLGEMEDLSAAVFDAARDDDGAVGAGRARAISAA